MPKTTPSPTPLPPGNLVPFDSSLIFVLDDPISSKSSRAGELVRAHLKTAIIVAGKTVAPAGTPAQIRIVDVSKSDIADTYGFVDIFFEPLALPGGRVLPLRAPVARLAPHDTTGHESTVAAEDTVGDIFVPYYSLWQVFRKGKNFVLQPGSELPARTGASITTTRDGAIAIITPRPVPESGQAPSATFPVVPMATPLDVATPLPKTTPPPGPSASPGPAPTPTATVPP